MVEAGAARFPVRVIEPRFSKVAVLFSVRLEAEEMPPLTTSLLEELTLIEPLPLCAPASV